MLGIFLLPIILGNPVILNDEPVTNKQALITALFIVLLLSGFAWLWRRQYRSVRYVITSMRALIYMPVWGASWSYDFKTRKWGRDYSDSEYSPITRGYFTAETKVTRTGSQRYGTLTISNKRSVASDAGTIRLIKRIFPFLDGVIFDPANLQFTEIEHPEMAQKYIEGILDKYRPENDATP